MSLSAGCAVRGSLFILWAFLFLNLSPFSLALAQEAETVPQASLDGAGRVECPHCKNEITELLQRADAFYGRFESKEALKELLKALELEPQNYEALSKTCRAYIDIGDMIPESKRGWKDERLKYYLIAEQYARKTVEANPNGTWGHFYVAASLGKIAMHSSTARQIDLAHEIRAEVDKAIALDPNNGFAYHVLGAWQRRMAEIGQMSRLLASTLLWRSVPKGSNEEAERYLKKAVSLNPEVITHRLELAKTYVAMGKWHLARQQLNVVQELPIQFSDDSIHKKNAQRLLQEIKDR